MAGSPAHLFETADHLAGDPLARAAFQRRVFGRVVEDAVTEVKEDADEDTPDGLDVEFTD